MASLDIHLKKVNKVYNEGDVLAGVVVVQNKADIPHQGLILSVDGSVNLQLSAKNVGMFEAFYNSVKPIPLITCTLELLKTGKLPAGKTEIPFEIPLMARPNKVLYETYHGVFVNIQYIVKADMKRGMLNKDLQKQCEFILERKPEKPEPALKPTKFTITPDTLRNVKEKRRVPRFKITGHIDSLVCPVTKPFTGELIVENCSAPIKSIELQLVRVETCGCAEGYSKDGTEIQNIQLGDGDVCRNLSIPIYMIFPRMFTCPTLMTNNFQVEFEVNLTIVFQDDHLVTENFPIKIFRS